MSRVERGMMHTRDFTTKAAHPDCRTTYTAPAPGSAAEAVKRARLAGPL